MPDVIIRPADRADLPAVLAIYNDAVLHTTAIWNDTAVDLEDRERWFQQRTEGGYPVLAADFGGAVVGYASYGPFRPFAGYRHSAELSIYVAQNHRGKGIGRLLMVALLREAEARGIHALLAGIEAENSASIALHRAFGFSEVGRLPEVGQKFGRWLDLVFMQRLL